MYAFGWTREYTLALSWPIFIDLFGLIRRVRLDRAIDEMFIPYSAAKYGKESAKALFDGRGSHFFADEIPEQQFSEDDLQRARRRLKRIQKRRECELAQAAAP